MPQKALRPCGHPGCPGLVRKGQYCDGHARLHRKEYDDQRGSSSARGYGSRWRRLRAMYLQAYPVCVDPFGLHAGRVVAATEVDHKLAKKIGGTDAWENLQALCHECHSHKTAVVDGRWG